MPEFILDSAGTVHDVRAPSIEAVKRVDVDFCDLDAFTQGYIEALFFTESSPAYDSEEWFSDECKAAQEEGRADGNIPGDTGFSDLAPDSLARIIADCAAFQADNAELLELAYALEPGSPEFMYARDPIDPQRAGQLFWYARNGHGIGWDDNGNAECLAALQAACGWRTKFGEVHVWFGDHVEHGDAPLVHVQ